METVQVPICYSFWIFLLRWIQTGIIVKHFNLWPTVTIASKCFKQFSPTYYVRIVFLAFYHPRYLNWMRVVQTWAYTSMAISLDKISVDLNPWPLCHEPSMLTTRPPKWPFAGFLVDFVSSPVISGFTSAASVTIAVSQLKNLLGLQVQRPSKLPAILKTAEEIFESISTIKWRDSLLGFSCIFLLLIMKVRNVIWCSKKFLQQNHS